MKRLFILLIALMVAGLVACKGAVTETPNPCPGGGCGDAPVAPGGGDDDGGGNDPGGDVPACDDTAAELLPYANAAYAVSVEYPSCWSMAEKAAGDAAGGVAAQAVFSRSSASCPVEPAVEVTIARLKSGETLLSLAAAGSCVPGTIEVGELSGYFCDLLTEADQQGGIAYHRRYALAHGGSIYAVVSAVACEAEAAGAQRILEHIAIPGSAAPSLPLIHPIDVPKLSQP